MTGPFYVKDREVYVLSTLCKDCAFCDEAAGWCPMNPCVYFPGLENLERNGEEGQENS